MINPRDEDRDAWLAQALRHAPDANADAPPALSAAILREARAAAPRQAAARAAPAAPDTTGLLQWLTAASAWLARPPVAAGFASLMVATLAGVMWWDQPLDATLPRAPEVVSSTPQARAGDTPPAVVAAAPQAAPPAHQPPEANGEPAARGRLADKKEAEKSARALRPAGEPKRPREEADAAPAMAAAALPAPPPRAADTTNEAPAPFAERRERAAPAAKAAAESAGSVAADSAASPRDGLRALQGSASPALAKARPADTSEAALAALRGRIAQQPERWHWQRGAGAPQPMNAAVQAWLAMVDARAASRWQTGTGSAAREPANSLRLFRDGVLQATLGFSSSAVWVEAGGASAAAASVAALSESEADSLRQALDEATP